MAGADVNGDGKDTDKSRTSLIAWLSSHFISKDDLDAKLSDLAAQIAVDINKKTAEIEAAAAVKLDERTAEIDSRIQRQSDELNVQVSKATEAAALAASWKAGSQPAGDHSGCTLCAGAVTKEDVLQYIYAALKRYDADKTGKVDFALESAGGSVINTRCSETYQSRTAQMSIFGVPLWYTVNSPRVVIQPAVYPGDCWAFVGSRGYIVVQLSTNITVTDVSIEHIPVELSPTNKLDSAPKDFSVWGLEDENDVKGTNLGNFTYLVPGDPIQEFNIASTSRGYQFVELRVESNHGNPLFTCIYRLRVHGTVVNQS
jgi:SUN domain-containing protein 1/2